MQLFFADLPKRSEYTQAYTYMNIFSVSFISWAWVSGYFAETASVLYAVFFASL